MRHIFYIDPLEKLNLKKDSSLLLALTAQAQGHDCHLVFEKDLNWSTGALAVKASRFQGQLDGFYLKEFSLTQVSMLSPQSGDILHMRLDPPFDGRYLRYLWLLDQWERQGVRVINRPRGIMQFNEKLLAYQQAGSVPSWVGEDFDGFSAFKKMLSAQGVKEIIMKPLDLYSGIGVEKWDLSSPELDQRFKTKAHELGGPIVVQSFMPEVYRGEIRAIYYAGHHIGSILKKPKTGEFLSNIAQGAAFEKIELTLSVKAKCEAICRELSQSGVDWVAFDILGETPTEVNITCPGLLVEVSHAHQKNLALDILNLI
jgi:glutathione synthase